MRDGKSFGSVLLFNGFLGFGLPLWLVGLAINLLWPTGPHASSLFDRVFPTLFIIPFTSLLAGMWEWTKQERAEDRRSGRTQGPG
ncbi:MAG: hypothetical protein JO306_10875 [Gemmatimonadetes bacterium]|nr:hypothetical protein [Gemmatimonadota bacterium]